MKIYGQTHSPWVQAVLLGATEKRIEHQLITATPFDVLSRWGVLMPAAQFDSEDWMRNSPDILTHMGFAPLEDGLMGNLQAAWMGVLHRPDSPLAFFREFSFAGDPSQSWFRRTTQNFLRSFSAFYFFLLIRSVMAFVKPQEPENFGDQFVFWEERLKNKGTTFLGGDAPNSEDCLLFGIMQCHCSVPVPPMLALQNDERLVLLRQWIISMQERFKDYPFLYSARYFGNSAQAAKPASGWDQLCFWTGLTTWFLIFPVTVPLVIYLRRKVPT
jgi:hypothetical protein